MLCGHVVGDNQACGFRSFAAIPQFPQFPQSEIAELRQSLLRNCGIAPRMSDVKLRKKG